MQRLLTREVFDNPGTQKDRRKQRIKRFAAFLVLSAVFFTVFLIQLPAVAAATDFSSYEPNKIYFKNSSGQWEDDSSSFSSPRKIGVGETFELMAVLDDPRMAWNDLPDESNTGSSIWSMGAKNRNGSNFSITTRWEKSDNSNRWQVIATCAALLPIKSTGDNSLYNTTVINLSFNGVWNIDHFYIDSSFDTGVIYIKDASDRWIKNSSSLNSPRALAVGETFELTAVLDGPNMNGASPNTSESDLASYTGNALSINSRAWNKLDENLWQVTTSGRVNTAGKCSSGVFWEDPFIVNLSFNGNPQLDVLYIEAVDLSNYNDKVIYVKDPATGTYKAMSEITVTVGETLELLAVIKGNPKMNGNGGVQDGADGSGFWHDPVTGIDTSWKQAGSFWMATASYTVTKSEEIRFAFTPANGNGNMYQAVLQVNAETNSIHVRNIEIGNKSYVGQLIDRHTATQMFSSDKSGRNTADNRYTVYVGDTLDVTSTVSGSFSCSNSNMEPLPSKTRSADSDASFLALTPGDCTVIFTTGAGQTENFYVKVAYPINVVTSLGEYSKDAVHEFLKLIHQDNISSAITDPNGEGIYLPNDMYTHAYWMYPYDTVVLTTYVAKNAYSSNMNFSHAGNISPTGDKEVEDVENGFVRITQTFKAGSYGSFNSALVRFGETVFYIEIRDPDSSDGADHFDIEIHDGSTYTITKSTTSASGKTDITTTVYKSYVDLVNLCTVYGANDRELGTLQSGEYWRRGYRPDDTQFELTSAYVTKNGKLVDSNGNDITSAVERGERAPDTKQRDINAADIQKVVFNVKLLLIPESQTVTTIVYDDDGNMKESTKQVAVNPKDEIYQDNILLTMNERDILDAFNKCPDHSGYDFVTLGGHEVDSELGGLQVSKTVTGMNYPMRDEFSFVVELSGLYSVGNEEMDAEELTGKFGDMEFKNGRAEFTLRHGESKLANGLPSGVQYTVTEIVPDGFEYTVTKKGFIGRIPTNDVRKVTFINAGNDVPQTGDNSHLELWMLLMAMSAVSICLCTTRLLRKKA